jgi:hypothetical protein
LIVEVGDAGVPNVIPPQFAIHDHAPVPTVGVFAASVVLLKHVSKSDPALAVVGRPLAVMIT